MKERSIKIKNINISLILFFMILFSINQINSKNSFISESIKNKNPNTTLKEKEKLDSLFNLNLKKFKENKTGIFNKFTFIEIKNTKKDENSNKKTSKKSKEKKEKNSNDENFLEKKVTQKRILQKGWLKYMEITENLNRPPNNFYLNTNYYTIKASNPYSKIPGKYFFYFELTLEKLTIYNGDDGNRRKISELEIISIGENPKINPCFGGIEKIGHFTEGFCFLIKFRNGENKVIWEICDNNANKINALIQNLIKAQEYIKSLLRAKGNNKNGKNIIQNILYLTKFIYKNFSDAEHCHLEHSIKKISNPNTTTEIFEDKNQSQNRIDPLPFGTSKITKIQNGMAMQQIITTPTPGTIVSPLPAPGTILVDTLNPTIPIVTTTPPLPLWAPSSKWSPCTKPCGGGTQIRTYICKEPSKCSGFQQRQRMCNLKKCKKNLDDHISNLQKVASGKWEYLGNWTPCTKKCGFEGSQSIKRICVNGNCLGKKESISKPCNVKACKSDKKKNKSIFNKCKNLLGEFDLFNGREIIHTIVEVNMKNIEFYRRQNTNEKILIENKSPFLVLTNSDLIKFSQNKKNKNCMLLKNPENFGIKNHNKKKTTKIKLCNSDNNLSMEHLPKKNFCVDWIKKFKKFKKKCSQQLLEKTLKTLEESATKKIDPSEMIKNISKKIKGKKNCHKKKDEKLLELKFEEFKKQANQIMQKEMSYEKSVLDQQKTKLECEDKKLNDELKKEEFYTKKILGEMKSKKKKNKNFALKEKMMKREMKNIMNKLDAKISEQRLKMLKDLEKMKDQHNEKRKKAVQRLMDLKKNLKKGLMKLKGGKGKPGLCFSKKGKILAYRKEYCFKNFKDKMLVDNCLKESQFCYACCDSELQNACSDDLKCCYSKCDAVANLNTECNVFYNSYHIKKRGFGLFD